MADETYMLFAFHDYYPGGGSGDLAIAPFAAASDEDAVGIAQRTRASGDVGKFDQWELIAVRPGGSRDVWEGGRLAD